MIVCFPLRVHSSQRDYHYVCNGIGRNRAWTRRSKHDGGYNGAWFRIHIHHPHVELTRFENVGFRD